MCSSFLSWSFFSYSLGDLCWWLLLFVAGVVSLLCRSVHGFDVVILWAMLMVCAVSLPQKESIQQKGPTGRDLGMNPWQPTKLWAADL